MTEAYKCDRCGEMEAQPPALKVGTTDIELAGSISSFKRDRHRDTIGAQITTPGNDCKYEINAGDLCEECAEEFREFWDGENE